ncbi:MAG: cytochrome c family protein [Roseovarius sp.]|uniref:c-type cytochrome n=1 Tax=Roseovarius sp. TaxID=1486281 RepID=UPI0032EAE7F9
MFDTMTFTKIVGGLCGALLIFLLGKWAAELIYHGPGGHGEDHAQGYVIDTGSEGSEGGSEGESGPSFAELFVSADASKGERVFNKCKACHTVEEGANGTGPYLYGVVGRDVASADGFSYSGNLVAAADVWTPENLSAFLESPSGFAPGTTMGFSGLGSIEDRANVIAYLDQTDGDTYEMEVPEEEASEEGTEEASAEGEEGAAEEGAADEGAAEGEAAEEGAADEGAAEGEAAEEGAADEGAAEEGAADEGAAEDEAAGESAEDDVPAISAEQVTAEEPEQADVSPTPSAEADAASVTENGDAVLVDEEADATTEETDGAGDASGDAAEEGSEESADEEAASEEEASAEGSGFAAMVASADPAEGEKVFRKCKACHVVDSEQNRVGPHLVNLVGRDVAGVEGFRYSNALQELGGQWTEDRLNEWLEDSKGMAPGNKMAFAGLKDEADRAAVVAYIESASN